MKYSLFFCLVAAYSAALTQQRYDVVITEIMADPSPQVGMPGYEWIELKNISATPVNLLGWRIGDENSFSGPMPAFLLMPDSFVIVCSNPAASVLTAFGVALAVSSFPSLDNSGDLLQLKTSTSMTMHAVEYTDSWYGNDLKKLGGWSLEICDPSRPCLGAANWKASVDPAGATPANANSTNSVITDQDAPTLLRSFSTDSLTIIAVFDESIDSATGSIAANYRVDGGLTIIDASAEPPLFKHVLLKLNLPMQEGINYELTCNSIKDCTGNQSASAQSTPTGVAGTPQVMDIVINEILFNPRSNAEDYIEIYNAGNGIADASKLHLANRSGTGGLNDLVALKTEPFFLFPGDFLVVTESLEALQLNYLVSYPGRVSVLSSLPSFADDEGRVVLTGYQGNVIDEVHYDADWHFKLLQDVEGVSLERIDPKAASQDKGNWHSAASTAGYGTPGYRNSQSGHTEVPQGEFGIVPKIFSPDNDGLDDYIVISYKISEPGFVANLLIFDAAGNRVRHLVRNAILGTSGSWTWDGLNEHGARLPIGIYILYAEIFNLQGKKRNFKNAVVLARKLN